MKNTFGKLAFGLSVIAIISSCSTGAHHADVPFSPTEKPVYFKGHEPVKSTPSKTRTAETADEAQ